MFSELAKALVLIVDDMPLNQQLLQKVLERAGYQVLVASSGAAALELAQTHHPDLVLMDVMMPEMDGMEACRRFKQTSEGEEVPVIFLTALTDTESMIQGFEAGGGDYLTKPFQEVELLVRLKTHLELRFAKLTLSQKNTALKEELVERRRFEDELLAYEKELEQKINLDELTQVANRRGMNEYMNEMIRHLSPEESPLAVVMCDIDYFKRYNDHYGHQRGDNCLKEVAQAIRRAKKRPIDLVARYGGEEFLVILPHATNKEAERVAQEIAKELAEVKLEHNASLVAPVVTLSMGVASILPTGSIEDSCNLVEAADQALYIAKQKGRNCIEVAADPKAEA